MYSYSDTQAFSDKLFEYGLMPEVESDGSVKSIRKVMSKLLPDYIYSLSYPEGCTFDVLDIQTYVVDGITVGGHRVYDEELIRNLANAYRFLLGKLDQPAISLKSLITTLHTLLTVGLLDNPGQIRREPVRITGTKTWKTEPIAELPGIFENELQTIEQLKNPVERALNLFLWLCYRQFFSEGNKRTARLVANYVFMRDCGCVFVINPKNWREFSGLLVKFYDTKEAQELIDFIAARCLCTFKDDKVVDFIV